ncbi:MAG: ankyrin repeat domain-containing protein [Acidobacteriota bacterium]
MARSHVAVPNHRPLLFTLLGLNRAGRILYAVLFALAIPALAGWFILLPRLRFSDEDERLFRAARHGDRAAVERSLAAGGRVNGASPVDGKTPLFRAAVFGHADVATALLEHGADVQARGSDNLTVLDVVRAARAAEKDPALAGALDAVVRVVQAAQP